MSCQRAHGGCSAGCCRAPKRARCPFCCRTGADRLATGCLSIPGCMQERLQSARSALASVQAACEAVRSSQGFLAVLRAVLAAGNTLNHGTARGNAAAIKLESLSKLVDMKVSHLHS